MDDPTDETPANPSGLPAATTDATPADAGFLIETALPLVQSFLNTQAEQAETERLVALRQLDLEEAELQASIVPPELAVERLRQRHRTVRVLAATGGAVVIGVVGVGALVGDLASATQAVLGLTSMTVAVAGAYFAGRGSAKRTDDTEEASE